MVVSEMLEVTLSVLTEPAQIGSQLPAQHNAAPSEGDRGVR